MEYKGIKQGFDKEVFKKAVKVAAGLSDFVQVQIFDAIVKNGSQDEDSMTCIVDSVDSSLSNLAVRYNLCISDGEINVPEDGSTVTIAKTAFTDPYIVRFTDLKSKLISIGNQVYSNDGELQEFNFYQNAGVEGSFGGFIKSLDPTNPNKGLLARINKIENLLNELILNFNSHTHIYSPGGGAPIVTATPIPTESNSIIPITTSSDIENEHITHGIKNKPIA